MLSLKPGPHDEASDRQRRRRATPSFLAALAVNALVFAVFLKAVTISARWIELFDKGPVSKVAAERIGFVRLPQDPTRPPTAGRDGGDGRPVGPASSRPAAPLRAPTTVPDEVPTEPDERTGGAAQGTGDGSGAVVGAGGPAEGIRPNYSDDRLWAPPGPLVAAPKTAKQRIDSVIADRFRVARDSIDSARTVAEGQRKPGDWTFDGPGGKWGWDQRAVRLGKISIPNALLGLIPNNIRTNPIETERERTLAQVRADILQHAQREMSEDGFRQAVREVRRRKDAERAARLAARAREQQGTEASGQASATP